jgi:hypothetical protein
MKKTFFLLLLLPGVLFSQNYSAILFSDNVSNLQLINQELALNTYSQKAEGFINDDLIDVNSPPPSAEVLNFSFECGFIKWSTASETNNSHFLLMFSRDGKSWNILGQIYGAGNSNAMNNYKYPTDLKDVYFKLYQMDFDGKSKEYGPVFGSCKKTKTP